MTAPSEERPPAGQTPYLLDTETLTEMNRLLSLDGIFTRSMGGPLPEQEDLSHVTRVLDLACGPGGWALLVAERYPQMQVMGIDISPQMIGYARERARAQSLANASFQVMNILQPLAFPEASFDLINARLLFGFIPPIYWPTLLQECRRVLTPGGILRCTETERNISNSPAHMELEALTAGLLHRLKQTPSVDPHFYSVVINLPSWFRQAGFADVRHRTYLVEFSTGTEAHAAVYEHYKILWSEMVPVMVQQGMISQEAIERLTQQALNEMLAETFVAGGTYTTVWGTKR